MVVDGDRRPRVGLGLGVFVVGRRVAVAVDLVMNLPATVRNIYHGSNGDQTKTLYARLAALGPVGEVALNLFRACKNSERAKVYRGGQPGRGSYKRMAYDRKSWAVGNVCAVLETHAAALGTVWGWQCDEATPGFEWVLYVETPHGQVSFHARSRGTGPDYPHTWDGVKEASAERVITWCEALVGTGAVLEVAS